MLVGINAGSQDANFDLLLTWLPVQFTLSVMTDSIDTILANIPERLRSGRAELGYSLDTLAGKSGVSRSMISQIERGESSPSISTLLHLAQALRLDMTDLLNTAPPAVQINVLRSDEIPSAEDEDNQWRVRSITFEKGHDWREVRVEAGGTLTNPGERRGAASTISMINGSAELSVGGKTVTLDRMDAVRFDSDQPHEIRAVGGVARFYILVDAG